MNVSVHLSYILGSLPLDERFAAATEAGFSRGRVPVPVLRAGKRVRADYSPRMISYRSQSVLRRLTIRRECPATQLTPRSSAAFDESITTAIDYAQVIGCPLIHVFAGPRAPDVTAELALDTYCRNLKKPTTDCTQQG